MGGQHGETGRKDKASGRVEGEARVLLAACDPTPGSEVCAHSPGADARWIALGRIERAVGCRRALDSALPWWAPLERPPSGLSRGARTRSDHVLVEDFELSAGIDVDGNRVLGPAHARLLHAACAPVHARFALRTFSGGAIALQPGDRLVPTLLRGEPPREVVLLARGGYVLPGATQPIPNREVVWRIRRGGRVLRFEVERVESGRRLLGLRERVRFEPPPAYGCRAAAWRTQWWGRSWVAHALDASGYAPPRHTVWAREAGQPQAQVAIDPSAIEALLPHVGDGAFEAHARWGARLWGVPDVLWLADGRCLRAHILRVRLAGHGWLEMAVRAGEQTIAPCRAVGALLGAGLCRREVMDAAGRRMRLCMRAIDGGEGRAAIEALQVWLPPGIDPGSWPGSLDAERRVLRLEGRAVRALAWEDRAGVPPWVLWRLHEEIGARRPVVLDRDVGPHPWGTVVRALETRALEPEALEPEERAAWQERPGAWTGSRPCAERRLFETRAGRARWRYWVRFAPGCEDEPLGRCDGAQVLDFDYLGHDRPWLLWRSRLRAQGRWPGESELRGLDNEWLRRLWLAATLPGAGGSEAAPIDLTDPRPYARACLPIRRAQVRAPVGARGTLA